jgi:MFS family permease
MAKSGSKKRSVKPAAAAGGLSVKDRLMFYSTVTITGASVMMIELLGTRIIGPFYGVSLIVWSSLLSVALIALAAGYAVGGRLADRAPRVRLSHILFLAGLWIGLVPLISEPVQLAANALGLRAGAFTSALVLFTGPLMLLGMAGPFVIKMAADRLDHVGSTAGNVFAVSTVGSVLGTLLLGFYLLPIAGTRTIILSLSLVLMGLGLCLFLYERRHFRIGHSPAVWAV